jgi:hypothetical protein
MAQGQKYNDDIKEKAYALLAVNNNAGYVANQLGIPYTTIKSWEKKWLAQSAEESSQSNESKESEVTNVTKCDESSLVELRKKNKEKFVNDAWSLIDKTKTILERRLDRAITSEDEIDALVDEITKLDHKTLTDTQRKSLYMRISAIKVESLKEIAVVLGTLYDKQALANKEATAIVEGNIEVKKFEDF